MLARSSDERRKGTNRRVAQRRSGQERQRAERRALTVAVEMERRSGEERRVRQRRQVRSGSERRRDSAREDLKYAYDKVCQASDLLTALTASADRRLHAAIHELSLIPGPDRLPTERARELYRQAMAGFHRKEKVLDTITRLPRGDMRRIGDAIRDLRHEITVAYYAGQ